MRVKIAIFILLLVNNAYGQGRKLIQVDSSNYVMIGDTLRDVYGVLSDSIVTYKSGTEFFKTCPCEVENVRGLISYNSHSFTIKRNECFYIFQKDSAYFINAGRMTNIRNTSGRRTWQFKTRAIKKKQAIDVISVIKKSISESEVPRYKSVSELPIVHDGTTFVFGDIPNQAFGVTPLPDFSKSVNSIIKLSQKLIKQNYK